MWFAEELGQSVLGRLRHPAGASSLATGVVMLRLARELPSIPQEFIDQFVKGPMSAEAIQDTSIVAKKPFRRHVPFSCRRQRHESVTCRKNRKTATRYSVVFTLTT
jgi:hypothetical protein